MTMYDGTNTADVHALFVDYLGRLGFHHSPPDGYRHPNGQLITIGYSGRQLRVRKFQPDDIRHQHAKVWDINRYPSIAQIAEFLGEPPMSRPPAPPLSMEEQMVIDGFEAAPVLPESWEGQKQAVQVVLGHPEARLPHRVYDGDAGVDLYTSEAVTVHPGTFADVPTGIRLGLPTGYWARITGRSSTLRKRGLLVTEAVIDNGYTGPIFAGLWNLTRSPQTVEVGERVAQVVLYPVIAVPFVPADQIESADGRGAFGFGSSGS